MITVEGQPILEEDGRFRYPFNGLSTDKKSIKEYQGHLLANASSFFEIDTRSCAFYDQEHEKWWGGTQK